MIAKLIKLTWALKTVALLCLLKPTLGLSSAWDELSVQEQQSVLQGKLVYKSQNIGGAWPKMFSYQFIAASPLEVAAVSFDYEMKPKYTSNLKSAKITKIHDPLTVEVSYYVELPFIGGENFTLWQDLTPWNNLSAFSSNWKLVRADKTKQSDGYARMEPVGSGTLFATVSYVDPGVPGASFAAGMAEQQFKDASIAFGRQVITLKQSYPDYLNSEIESLRQAIAKKWGN